MTDTELLLVVGPGRSGTSVVSMLGHQLGWRIPQPEVEPNETNPRGFGESLWAVEFHRRALREAGVLISDARPAAWTAASEYSRTPAAIDELARWLTEQSEVSDRILVKDPRSLWFLDLWQTAADRVGLKTHYATMLRHPAECVASREQWYGTEVSLTGKLAAWVNASIGTERKTRGRSRTFVQLDHVLADWQAAMQSVEDALEAPFLTGATAAQIAAADGLVDAKLRRSKASWGDLEFEDRIQSLADTVWNAELALADPDGDHGQAQVALAECEKTYGEMYRGAEEIVTTSIAIAGRSNRKLKHGQAQATTTPSTPQPGPSTLKRLKQKSARDIVVAVGRRVPARIRHRVPLALRQRAAAVVQGLERTQLLHGPVRAIDPVTSWKQRQDLLIQAAERVAVPHAVLPEAFPRFTLAVAADRRADYLQALDSLAPTHIRWPGRNGGKGPDAASSTLTVTDDSVAPGRVLRVGAGYTAQVEFWTHHDHTLTAPRPNLMALHTVRTADDPPLATRPWDVVDAPVDLVYLWVDGDDPRWGELRARYSTQMEGAGATATSEARFQNRDELRFSLRSAYYYVPWANRIHLVTMGQRPAWLADHDYINLVDHHEIFDPNDLPTFNSNAIISRLHHIPGLAENYVLMNDDVFFGRPLSKRTFFAPAGQAKVAVSKVLIQQAGSPADTVLDAAHRGVQDLVARDYGVQVARRLKHGPHSQLKSWQHALEQQYTDEYHRTAASRFRAATDTDPLYLHAYIGLRTGKVVPGDLKLMYAALAERDLSARLDRILRNPETYDAICLNDTAVEVGNPEAIEAQLSSFLNKRYPIPAPWERSSSG